MVTMLPQRMGIVVVDALNKKLLQPAGPLKPKLSVDDGAFPFVMIRPLVLFAMQSPALVVNVVLPALSDMAREGDPKVDTKNPFAGMTTVSSDCGAETGKFEPTCQLSGQL